MLDHIVNFVIDEDDKIGTKFKANNVHPKNLPNAGLLDPDFEATEIFSAEPDSPPAIWGIDPGEKLQLFFDLLEGKTFSNVINELNSGGELRIGIHIQSLGPGGNDSVSAVNVPEPMSIMLLSLGSLYLFGRRRAQ